MRNHGVPDRRSLVASVTIHAAAVVLAFVTAARPEPSIDFVTYEIELVSLPPAAQAEEERPATEELVVERPEPTPPEPEAPEEAVPVEEPEPEPTPPKPEQTRPEPPKPDEKPAPAASPDSARTETSTSGENLNVRMEGLQRDYPEYYDNIIRQINRCFRWRGEGRWSTVLYFEIERSGSVREIRVLEPSGNPIFDIEAQGAVECAGQGRLGPLPEDLPYDRFPIRFRIDPRGGEQVLTAEGATDQGAER